MFKKTQINFEFLFIIFDIMNNKQDTKQVKSCNNCFFKQFKTWKPILKAIFILGWILLIIDFSILLHYMNIHGIQKAIQQLKSSGADSLIGQGDKGKEFFPNALALMWNQGTTFTMISNWLLAISMIVFPLYASKQKAQFFFFFAVTNITITFIIYWTLIFFVSLKNGVWHNPSAAIPSFILHAINPLFGFIMLGLVRKDITLKTSQLWLTNIMVLLYFFMAMIMFFIGKQIMIKNVPKFKDQYSKYNVVVYAFLNFEKPLFYKGGKIAIIVILDLLMFLLGAFLAPAFAWMWKGIFKIKRITNDNCSVAIKNINTNKREENLTQNLK